MNMLIKVQTSAAARAVAAALRSAMEEHRYGLDAVVRGGKQKQTCPGLLRLFSEQISIS